MTIVSEGVRSRAWGCSNGCLFSCVVLVSRSKLYFSSEACWSMMKRSLPNRARMNPRLNWPKIWSSLNCDFSNTRSNSMAAAESFSAFWFSTISSPPCWNFQSQCYQAWCRSFFPAAEDNEMIRLLYWCFLDRWHLSMQWIKTNTIKTSQLQRRIQQKSDEL